MSAPMRQVIAVILCEIIAQALKYMVCISAPPEFPLCGGDFPRRGLQQRRPGRKARVRPRTHHDVIR